MKILLAALLATAIVSPALGGQDDVDFKGHMGRSLALMQIAPTVCDRITPDDVAAVTAYYGSIARMKGLEMADLEKIRDDFFPHIRDALLTPDGAERPNGGFCQAVDIAVENSTYLNFFLALPLMEVSEQLLPFETWVAVRDIPAGEPMPESEASPEEEVITADTADVPQAAPAGAPIARIKAYCADLVDSYRLQETCIESEIQSWVNIN